MKEIIRKGKHVLQIRKFNDMTDHDIDVDPVIIFEDLGRFNVENLNDKMKIEYIEDKGEDKNYVKLTIKDDGSLPGVTKPDEEADQAQGPGDEENEDIIIKVKFFQISDTRTRVRFVLKQGNIMTWYQIFKQMKEL